MPPRTHRFFVLFVARGLLRGYIPTRGHPVHWLRTTPEISAFARFTTAHKIRRRAQKGLTKMALPIDVVATRARLSCFYVCRPSSASSAFPFPLGRPSCRPTFAASSLVPPPPPALRASSATSPHPAPPRNPKAERRRLARRGQIRAASKDQKWAESATIVGVDDRRVGRLWAHARYNGTHTWPNPGLAIVTAYQHRRARIHESVPRCGGEPQERKNFVLSLEEETRAGWG